MAIENKIRLPERQLRSLQPSREKANSINVTHLKQHVNLTVLGVVFAHLQM